MWGCGDNSYKQLGSGPNPQPLAKLQESVLDIAAGVYHTLCLRTDGLFAAGNNSNRQLGTGESGSKISWSLVAAAPKFSSIYAGGFCSFGISNDELYGWYFIYFFIQSSLGEIIAILKWELTVVVSINQNC